MKKRISLFHLCIISIIFLFFITFEAMAGTYVYYNEKGEKVSYINKNENQNSNKANTKFVQSVDMDKNNTLNNIDPKNKNLQDNKKR